MEPRTITAIILGVVTFAFFMWLLWEIQKNTKDKDWGKQEKMYKVLRK